MQSTMTNGQKTIDYKDAEILEMHEQTVLRNRRTRRAIEDTYGAKSPTKLRRRLSGKRHWKNKTNVYAKLQGHMTATEFNSGQKAQRVLDKIYKEKASRMKRHSIQE